jgi:hypothetical protein
MQGSAVMMRPIVNMLHTTTLSNAAASPLLTKRGFCGWGRYYGKFEVNQFLLSSVFSLYFVLFFSRPFCFLSFSHLLHVSHF